MLPADYITSKNNGRSSSLEERSDSPRDHNHDPEHLAILRERIRQYTSQFQEVVQCIVASLAAHSDLDLRFLSCRINFSLFYLVGKSKR